VSHLEFSELFAFPMSGGYVGPVIVPARPRWLGGALLAADQALGSALASLRLARFAAWRYLLVADLP
jgi:hypothetical protein